MDLYIDGEKVVEQDYSAEKLNELLEKISDNLEGRNIANLFINDEEFNPNDIGMNPRLNNINRIEVTTKNVTGLLENSIDDLQEFLPSLIENFAEIIKILKSGDFSQGRAKLFKALQSLQMSVKVMSQAMSTIEDEKLRSGYNNLLSRIREVNKTINSLIKEIENQKNESAKGESDYKLTEVNKEIDLLITKLEAKLLPLLKRLQAMSETLPELLD